MSPGPRSRALLLPLMVLVVALGLGSRSQAARLHLPRFVTDYAGDALWTVMVYLCLVFVLPRLSVRRAAASALGLSVLVELSQLVHTPWLDALRAHRLGALVLGRGFLASDLVCYAVGAGLAAGTDLLLARRPPAHALPPENGAHP
ncbi:ribosomal maturation YjgA family protein [Archangium violaceum]|uniref:ribosomal maturation YjgA family protein n=1 Tax=Archangium violaceum TaxID=83451 RepID=UPI0036D77D3D